MASILDFRPPDMPAGTVDDFDKGLLAASILLDYTPHQALAIMDSWVENEIITVKNRLRLHQFLGFIK